MVLVEFPWAENAQDYMYFSTRHWARLINGYSGSFPDAFIDLQKHFDAFPGAGRDRGGAPGGATHLTFNCTLEVRKYRLPAHHSRAGRQSVARTGFRRPVGGDEGQAVSAQVTVSRTRRRMRLGQRRCFVKQVSCDRRRPRSPRTSCGRASRSRRRWDCRAGMNAADLSVARPRRPNRVR
jgi:hypothetical protein